MSLRSSLSSFQVFWVLFALVSLTCAQTNKLFQWQFANNALSTSLPTCLGLNIIAKPFDINTNATNGTPPFYMISLAVGGTPQTAFIGTDENNLLWTVTHAPGELFPNVASRSTLNAINAGTRLILQVVDANGSAGGIPPRIFDVIAGQTTQCVITPKLDPPFTVTANVTGKAKLNTCQPWGLTIAGGVPPYNLTLVQPNSPITTNVTIGLGDDVFTYINRANPNSQLLAAISDLTGRWASGTPIVDTIGSDPDPACTGLNSSSGTSAQIRQEAQAAAAVAKAASRQRTTAIAVSLTLIFLALGCLVLSFYIYRVRRQQRRREQEHERKPRQYVLGEQDINKGGDLESGPPVILSITRFLDSDENVTPRSKLPTTTKQSMQMPWRSPAKGNIISPTDTTTTGSPISDLTDSNQGSGSDSQPSSTGVVQLSTPNQKGHTRTASFSKFPTRPIRVPSKLAAGGLAIVNEAQTPSTAMREPPPPPYAAATTPRRGRGYSR